MTHKFTSFHEFFPFYLHEHRHPVNRALHLMGTTIGFMFVLLALLARSPVILIYAPLSGYSFAWVGHFYFEKNKPATFTYPVYFLSGPRF